jgi:serine phosphatase RsbU (regulator of sigma subunit)
MLQTLHRALRLQPPGADLCTVCLVVMSPLPADAQLTVALAGHPPPLLIGADGQVRPAGSPGTLLGVIDPIRLSPREVQLRSGDTLLMYTDGVLDAGRELGESGLAKVCGEAHALPLEALIAKVEQAALQGTGERLRDDLMLLGLRVR